MKKINIIFDIDNTLVHSLLNEEYLYLPNLTKYSILSYSKGKNFLTLFRNYCSLLLDYCFEHYNVGFWSTGTEKYILSIIKKLVPNEKNFKKINLILVRDKFEPDHIIYKNYLNKKKYKVLDFNNGGIKALDLLFIHQDFKRTFNKKNTLLVDDLATNIANNKLNTIYIPAFCYEKQDNILLKLLIIFMKIKDRKNVQCLDIEFYKIDGPSYNCLDRKISKKLTFGDMVKYEKDGLLEEEEAIIIDTNKSKYSILLNSYKIVRNIDKKNLKKIL